MTDQRGPTGTSTWSQLWTLVGFRPAAEGPRQVVVHLRAGGAAGADLGLQPRLRRRGGPRPRAGRGRVVSLPAGDPMADVVRQALQGAAAGGLEVSSPRPTSGRSQDVVDAGDSDVGPGAAGGLRRGRPLPAGTPWCAPSRATGWGGDPDRAVGRRRRPRPVRRRRARPRPPQRRRGWPPTTSRRSAPGVATAATGVHAAGGRDLAGAAGPGRGPGGRTDRSLPVLHCGLRRARPGRRAGDRDAGPAPLHADAVRAGGGSPRPLVSFLLGVVATSILLGVGGRALRRRLRVGPRGGDSGRGRLGCRHVPDLRDRATRPDQ